MPSPSLADALFRRGDLRELIQSNDSFLNSPQRGDPRLRVLLAHALALTGQLQRADQLALLDRGADTPPSLRSRAEAVAGIVSHMRGNLQTARHCFQLSIRHAQEASDPEQLAWAHLHLYRLLVNGHPMEGVVSLLVMSTSTCVSAR
jgi:hypothetical protein